MAKEELPEHAYLKSVKVKGFRTLKDSEAEFVSGLNIIIGENGVGKSNLLKLINDVVLGDEGISLFLQEMTAKIIKGENTYTLELEFKPNIDSFPNSSKYIHLQSNFYKNKEKSANQKEGFKLGYQYHLQQIKYNLKSVVFNLPSDTKTLLNPTEFEIHVVGDKNRTYFLSKVFGHLGSYLGYFADFMAFQSPNDTDLNYVNIISKRISDVVNLNSSIPYLSKYSPIKDVRLSNFNVHQNKERILVDNLYFEFLIDDQWLPWYFLSDGTKRLFYLINEVVTAENTVLIEEPELGVHPHQFHSIMLFLKEQAQYKQIILTTHSPYALNVLKKDDLDSIIIAKLDKDKGSVFKHLNEEQKAKALRYMTDVDYLSSYWMHSDLEDDEEED